MMTEKQLLKRAKEHADMRRALDDLATSAAAALLITWKMTPEELDAFRERFRKRALKARRCLDKVTPWNPNGCDKHALVGCIECEKRCVGCGDDGKMAMRHGQRSCENCVWCHDQGEWDCGEGCPDRGSPKRGDGHG